MPFELTRAPLRAGPMLARVLVPGAGGVELFAGIVRADRTTRGRVRALHYEAYAPLVLSEMARLEREARRRFALLAVEGAHRLGRVRAGEVSVLLAVAAAHRRPAREGLAFLVEGLKSALPIWKEEAGRGRASRRPRRPLPPRGAPAAGSHRAPRSRGAPRRAG